VHNTNKALKVIAKLFPDFSRAPGRHFEAEIDGRGAEFRVLSRACFAVNGGHLESIVGCWLGVRRLLSKACLVTGLARSNSVQLSLLSHLLGKEAAPRLCTDIAEKFAAFTLGHSEAFEVF